MQEGGPHLIHYIPAGFLIDHISCDEDVRVCKFPDILADEFDLLIGFRSLIQLKTSLNGGLIDELQLGEGLLGH